MDTETIRDKLKAAAIYVKNACGIYLLWICIHFIAAHLYVYFCTPKTLIGFLLSPFITTAPHCKAILWTITTGANTINGMWVLLGAWLSSKITA
jgi:hypothetical protein